MASRTILASMKASEEKALKIDSASWVAAEISSLPKFTPQVTWVSVTDYEIFFFLLILHSLAGRKRAVR